MRPCLGIAFLILRRFLAGRRVLRACYPPSTFDSLILLAPFLLVTIHASCLRPTEVFPHLGFGQVPRQEFGSEMCEEVRVAFLSNPGLLGGLAEHFRSHFTFQETKNEESHPRILIAHHTSGSDHRFHVNLGRSLANRAKHRNELSKHMVISVSQEQ